MIERECHDGAAKELAATIQNNVQARMQWLPRRMILQEFVNS